MVMQCEDQTPGKEDLATQVQREMANMEAAIIEASQRFMAMLENSRAKDTGTQLEVREREGRERIFLLKYNFLHFTFGLNIDEIS